MTIELLISQINEQSDDAKVTLESILMEKIAQRLEEKKQEIMAEAFPPSNKEEKDSEDEESDEDREDDKDSEDDEDKDEVGTGSKDAVSVKD